MTTSATGSLLAAFAKQVGWCNRLGAPFTARLIALLAEDLQQGGRLAGMIGDWPGDPVADALPLRLAGAFHALVLSDADPDLAACYPPAGYGDYERLASVLSAALDRHAGFIRGFLASPPQTNEVGRSAVLLGGFLQIAADTELPLRLFEIGASAGLNLLWDRFCYRIGGEGWGDPASPVRLAPEWRGSLPCLATPVRITERVGCDIAPLDLRQPDAKLRLRSYVWADQPERLARLDGAIALARAEGTPVQRADAAQWAAERLSCPTSGQVSVLYHSIMWQYLPAATQDSLRATLERAGQAATQATPVAWLRFEPPEPETRPELRLTCWPGGRERRLATAHPHGSTVNWEGSS